jgi:hypothetical protein
MHIIVFCHSHRYTHCIIISFTILEKKSTEQFTFKVYQLYCGISSIMIFDTLMYQAAKLVLPVLEVSPLPSLTYLPELAVVFLRIFRSYGGNFSYVTTASNCTLSSFYYLIMRFYII